MTFKWSPYWLLVAMPVSAVLDAMGAAAPVIFFCAAVAIVPLAILITHSTEHLAARTGPALGGLLNATFGNASELIITAFAIHRGLLTLVKASITGSIIGNLLLVFGASALFGGLKHGPQRFDARAAGLHAAQLVLATIGLLVPALFAYLVHGAAPPGVAVGGPEISIEAVTLGVAAVLLATYGLAIAYDLRRPAPAGVLAREAGGGSWAGPLGWLVVAAALLGWMSQILVGAVEPVMHEFGLSPVFLGAIVIPILGNLAENLVAVKLARQDQMDFALAVALGSATQVALFAAPVLVFASLALGHPLTLVFTPFEVVAVGAGAVVTALLCLDGETNWLEGAQLLATYLILAVAFFFLPGSR